MKIVDLDPEVFGDTFARDDRCGLPIEVQKIVNQHGVVRTNISKVAGVRMEEGTNSFFDVGSMASPDFSWHTHASPGSDIGEKTDHLGILYTGSSTKKRQRGTAVIEYEGNARKTLEDHVRNFPNWVELDRFLRENTLKSSAYNFYTQAGFEVISKLASGQEDIRWEEVAAFWFIYKSLEKGFSEIPEMQKLLVKLKEMRDSISKKLIENGLILDYSPGTLYILRNDNIHSTTPVTASEVAYGESVSNRHFINSER